MTTATDHLPAPQGGSAGPRPTALVITGRNLRRIPRIPELAIFAIIQSIMFVLLFAFVFGGAIGPGFPDPNAYREYLLRNLRADHRLRRRHRRDRDVRRHQQGHHRPLPLVAHVPIGRPDRPEISEVVYNAGILVVPDAGRPGRRLDGPHGPLRLPGGRGPTPGVRLCDGLARGLARASSCRPWRSLSRCRSRCSSRSPSSRACSCRSTRCRSGCSRSPMESGHDARIVAAALLGNPNPQIGDEFPTQNPILVTVDVDRRVRRRVRTARRPAVSQHESLTRP